MAKKKKPVRKKKVEVVAAERSPFWALAGAILLILAALFLLLGGFGTGGGLPVNLFHGAYWAFGWAAYITPVALVYWGLTVIFTFFQSRLEKRIGRGYDRAHVARAMQAAGEPGQPHGGGAAPA